MQMDPPPPLVPTRISKPIRDSQAEAAALEDDGEQVSGQRAPRGARPGPRPQQLPVCVCRGICPEPEHHGRGYTCCF